MQGDVSLSVPLSIIVNDTFLANPTLMSKFRSDEVAFVRFRNCEKPVGQFLSYTSKMTKLSDLNLSESTAGTSDLRYLEKDSLFVPYHFFEITYDYR